MPNERSPRRSVSHPKLTRSVVASSSKAPNTRDVGMRSAISGDHINVGGGANRHHARQGDRGRVPGLAASLLRFLGQLRVVGLRWSRKLR
jgi:hypothetical protein